MKRYTLLTIIFLIVFLGGLVFSSQKIYYSKATPSIPENVQEEKNALALVLPQAQSFIKESGIRPHFKAFAQNPKTGQKEWIGIAYLTTDIVPEITGYSGPIKIMVGANRLGTIQGVRILSEFETSSYVNNLEKFIRQFIGLSLTNNFQLGKDLDGITGATISSEAMTRSIDKSLKIMTREVLNQNLPGEIQKKGGPSLTQVFILFILFVSAIISLFLRNKRLRGLVLLAGFIYFGLITANMFSIIEIANIGLLKFPSFALSPLWYALIGLTFVTLLLFGNVYCGYLCPFAALEEFLYRIFPKTFPRIKPSSALDKNARYLKYIVLFLTLVACFILGNSDVAAFEPYVLLFTAHASALGWAFVVTLLILSIFNFRFWCKYFCPVGALNGLLSRFSIFKIRVGKDCDDCGICLRVCPTDAIKVDKSGKTFVDFPECILCMKCLQNCPKDTFKYMKKVLNEKS